MSLSRMTRRETLRFMGRSAAAGTASCVIALAGTAAYPRFEPKEYVGFPALSMGDHYLSTLQTGDVLFFNQPAFIKGKPLKWLYNQALKFGNNKNEFEHMGVIVVHPKEKYPYVLEKALFGMTIATPFEDRVAWSGAQDIMVRTLHLVRTHAFQDEAQKFLMDELGSAQNLKLCNNTSILARSLMYISQFSSIMGQIIRDAQQPTIGATMVKQLASLEEISKYQYSDNIDDREKYDEVSLATSRHAATREIKQTQLPRNRVTLFAELIGSIRDLRSTENRVTKHLDAQKARILYEQELSEHRMKKLSDFKSHTNSLENALNSNLSEKQDVSVEPSAPPILKDEMEQKDFMLLLKKRDLLYDSFQQQYTDYKQLSLETAKYGFLYNPTYETETPAYPGCDLVTRLYQHLRLLPTAKYPSVGTHDVNELFPPGIYNLREKERAGDTDLRKFSFTEAYDMVSQWAPYSREFKPHHWRNHHNLYITQGILGDEQMIMQSFNKPPLEYRTGIDTGIISDKNGPTKL